MLVTKCIGDKDVGHGSCNQNPLYFNISVRQQIPEDVTNIEILSLTFKNCHLDKVSNIYVGLNIMKRHILLMDIGESSMVVTNIQSPELL